MKAKGVSMILAKLLVVAMLVAALGYHPYDYYTLLRWVVCVISVLVAAKAGGEGKRSWMWVFVVIALFFNPLFPVHLRRQTWAIIDVLTALVFVVSLYFIDLRRTPNEG